MGRTSEAYRRGHAIHRAWQHHGVDLNEQRYDGIVKQLKQFAAETTVRREDGATHHVVFLQRKGFVVVWDERQERIRTVLPPESVAPRVVMGVLRAVASRLRLDASRRTLFIAEERVRTARRLVRAEQRLRMTRRLDGRAPGAARVVAGQ